MSGEVDIEAKTEGGAVYGQSEREMAGASPITERDKVFIRILQQDLPIVAEPFGVWARQGGVSVEELLEAAKDLVKLPLHELPAHIEAARAEG